MVFPSKNFAAAKKNGKWLMASDLTKQTHCTTMYYKKGADFMSFSIRLSTEEKFLAESYAKLHAISLGEAFKKALFEKIEDEYDIAVAEEAHAEYVASGCKSTPVEDFWRELDAEV